MDPLTALSVAGTVTQFVQFASSLISTSHKVFYSPEGTTASHLQLEAVYSKLSELIRALESASTPQKSERDAALEELSKQCRADCAELLGILDGLKVEGEKHRLSKSIKSALRASRYEPKISAIERRLGRAQQVVALHVGHITR